MGGRQSHMRQLGRNKRGRDLRRNRGSIRLTELGNWTDNKTGSLIRIVENRKKNQGDSVGGD